MKVHIFANVPSAADITSDEIAVYGDTVNGEKHLFCQDSDGNAFDLTLGDSESGGGSSDWVRADNTMYPAVETDSLIIGGTSADIHASARAQFDADGKGMLFTRWGTAQRPVSPAHLLMGWNTDGRYAEWFDSGDSLWHIFAESGALTDNSAIHKAVAGEINAITQKSTPVAADKLLMEDSEDSHNKKMVEIGDIVALASGAVPTGLKTGLTLTRETADIMNVGVGSIEVDGTVVVNTAVKRLSVSTNGDWIDGSHAEAASTFVCQYVNAAGDFKLHEALPNYPRANTASRITTAQVNQSGWNGTGGSGLNATSVVYDNDSGGEGSVTAGMYALFYDDSAYKEGRGRGSGAAASVNNACLAKITAINTGTNTLTLEAGHNIAIFDDDYIVIIDPGPLEYINVSGVWWRFNDRMFNNSSSDLDENRTARMFTAVNDAGTNYTTTSASLVDIDSTNLACQIMTGGGAVHGEFAGMFSRAAGTMRLDWAIDGLRYAGDDGITSSSDSTMDLQVPMTKRVLPGTHTIAIQWSCTSGGLYAGAGTATLDTHPIMNVYEVRT